MSISSEPKPGPSSSPAAERGSTTRTGASVTRWFAGATRLWFSALREIFDESAYSRFLAQHAMSSCPSAYSAFLREQETIKARRPKCC
jgi:hypothetical protein